jgi:hypothetical protein
MIKYLTLLTTLLCFQALSQENEMVIIDRFNNSNDWKGNSDALVQINDGVLSIQNQQDVITYVYSYDIDNLQNKAYTEISFDIKISPENKWGGFSLISGNSEFAQLIFRPDLIYLRRYSQSYPDAGFRLASSPNNLSLESANKVKIVLDNKINSTSSKNTKVFINDVLILESEWAISNFNSIAFMCIGIGETIYDNLLIKQSEELSYVEDVFDYIFIDNVRHYDHNGIETKDLTKYIPIELVDEGGIISPTEEIIKSLQKNSKCFNIEIKASDFNSKKREKISFTYENSIIEFFTDTDYPSPIEVYFLDDNDLHDFFLVYSLYHSYRFTDENRSQWPSEPFYSILKQDDFLLSTIWLGMP